MLRQNIVHLHIEFECGSSYSSGEALYSLKLYTWWMLTSPRLMSFGRFTILFTCLPSLAAYGSISFWASSIRAFSSFYFYILSMKVNLCADFSPDCNLFALGIISLPYLSSLFGRFDFSPASWGSFIYSFKLSWLPSSLPFPPSL